MAFLRAFVLGQMFIESGKAAERTTTEGTRPDL